MSSGNIIGLDMKECYLCVLQGASVIGPIVHKIIDRVDSQLVFKEYSTILNRNSDIAPKTQWDRDPVAVFPEIRYIHPSPH